MMSILVHLKPRAVFLDRDGVLNEAVVKGGKPYPPASIEEFRIYPEAIDALPRLKASGFRLFVVTNQPDVARGTQSRAVVDAMNAALEKVLPLDGTYVCWHDDSDGCACRKPKPGLLLDAAASHGIDLRGSYMVGDRWRDVEAGAEAGCRTVQIERHYQEKSAGRPPDFTTVSLAEAVEWILIDCVNSDPS